MVSGNIKPVNIEDEVKSSYLDYAMSVIVSRALPDVRDGLKPVHRRILYAMNDMGLRPSGPHRKSARIVGEVLGKYHPHGDASVYDAMVRMAQDFSMRYPLVDGQGNFGSVDNDPPAAMRYTEARLAKIAEEMLVDIEKETVDFMSNFDDSLQEPKVLPARLPNLLLNGSAGIAVGMATNIPPHNLTEVCDAIAYLIESPQATIEELSKFVKGPDFPTAGIIQGREGIRNAYATGHGKIVVRARAHITSVSAGGRRQIIVSELPYQTNKAALIEDIAELVKDKKIDGIGDLRDESDRQGMRIVIEIKRESQPDSVLNNLFKHTAMQSSFFVNMLALVDGQPRVISLKEALQHHIDFRRQVITRRSKYELKQARARAHILEGLRIALDKIDAIIKTIRESETAEAARKNLMSRFGLSQLQAQAILDMQLRRLASLERQKIEEEYAEVVKTIAYLEDLLANPRRILSVIKEDIAMLKSKYGDKRRTEITDQGKLDFTEEDLIPHERVVVTLSSRGFIKRIPSRLYALQHRGGKGIIGQVTREEDAVMILTVADTHDDLYFFTDKGKVYYLKCHEIPAGATRTSKGLAIINLISILVDEKVTAMVATTGLMKGTFMVMATKMGEVKKTPVDNFTSVRSSGLIAMDLEAGDELVSVCLATDKDDVLLATRKGQSIRFDVKSLRSASRTSGGVRGMRVAQGDAVVGMDRADKEGYVLVVTEHGYGKVTSVEQYPQQHRGGSGVRTFKIVDKTGDVTAFRVVNLKQQVMLVSAEGMMTRTPVKEEDPRKGITTQGRSTQGVRVMTLEEGDKLVAITTFAEEEEKED
ncbi:MAG: DNA gyrase subunit A [Chloroflexi bacterium RBG_16_50_11]|nr:MAG: DNA gyrase subunit A [Chloroflexi bacterium RBG_16_50_11]